MKTIEFSEHIVTILIRVKSLRSLISFWTYIWTHSIRCWKLIHLIRRIFSTLISTSSHSVSFHSTWLRLGIWHSISLWAFNSWSRLLLVISVQHMSQYIFCIFQSLHHLKICRLHCTTQWISTPLTLLVHICHYFSLRTKHNFGMILEINLNHLVW